MFAAAVAAVCAVAVAVFADVAVVNVDDVVILVNDTFINLSLLVGCCRYVCSDCWCVSAVDIRRRFQASLGV